MDIFRSKEIYRKIRKREEGELRDPIVPIRGLYVVGDHMIPVYDNACVTIEKIETVHPKIVDYTDINQDVTRDHITKLTAFTMNNEQPTITRYSVASESLKPDYITKLSGFDLDQSITLLRYSKEYKELTPDYVTRLTSLTMDQSPPTFIHYYHKHVNTQPEPMVMITGINVTHCTVIDENT